MTSPTDLSQWYDRLHADVAGYRNERFRLGNELRQLYAIRAIGGVEAVIFHGARILELLSAAAVAEIGLDSNASTCSNLIVLEQCDLLSRQTRYWAHALRALGNGVRHIHREYQLEEADFALAFTEAFLDWYFCRFRGRASLPSLTKDGKPLGLCVDESLNRALNTLADLHRQPDVGLKELRDRLGEASLRSAVVPAVVADIWLNQGNVADARKLLVEAVDRHDDDLRLRQLYVLALSWSKDLPEANKQVQRLLAIDKHDDETLGIAAGVFKRLWQHDHQDVDHLQESHQLYRRGWKQSKNPYLGINAAATALWLGNEAASRPSADEVEQHLTKQIEQLAKCRPELRLTMDYWNQVTRAEALLLQGRLADAAVAYQTAFDAYPSEKGSFESTRRQIGQNLQDLHIALDDKELLAKVSNPPPTTAAGKTNGVRIGVTGHRRLPNDPRLKEQIRAALRQAKTKQPAVPLIVISALAEGADRWVAEIGLSDELQGRLEVELPLETADYMTDFSPDESAAEFCRLLGRADVVRHPASANVRPGPLTGDARNAAYEAVGRKVVNDCAVLLAIWNGQPAQGRGGTAEIVAYARRLARPLIWINSVEPFEVTVERI